MKSKVFSILQRIGRSFMLPIAVLPIAGLFLGIGSSLTNETTLATLQFEHILGNGTFIHDVLLIMTRVGDAIFTNLPLIFAASVALGMAKKEKEVAVLSAIIAFFVLHTTINGMLMTQGKIIGGEIATGVLDGTITNVCGILSLDMGVFGGIMVGLGVSYLHNRFYRIELPSALSFFEGTRFIPVISVLVFFIFGFVMYFIWPFIQEGIFSLGQAIRDSGYGGTFLYGIIKRLLVPFGLHHVFYLPFWQTAIGGAMEVQGTMIYGGQNIFFAQLADPNTLRFSSDATRYFSGEFIFMIFGLPGAALAMYQCAYTKHKKMVASLLLSASLTSMLTGITEPIEFAFLFAAPMLFGVQVILAGSAYMVAHICQIAVGLTFSGGVLDFLVFGVLQGNAKTNWMYVIPLGILYFLLYYGIFKFLIIKFDLKTPGRDEDINVTMLKKKMQNVIDPTEEFVKDEHILKQCQQLVQGLGGRENMMDYDSCITRIRVSVVNATLVQEGILKQSGAAAVVKQGNGVQIIYGPKASSIKSNLDEYLIHTSVEEDCMIPISNHVTFMNMVDGEVQSLKSCCDTMFSQKLLGDGIMIHPQNGLLVSPCNGVVSMVYPTKHAIGVTLDNACEVVLHVGIETVHLQGVGFHTFVEVGQRIVQGDILWNIDLAYVKEHVPSENILIVFTKIPPSMTLKKYYGVKKRGDLILEIIES